MHVIDTFNRKLDQKTHVKLRVVPDWAEPGTNTNEIIVGLANRPESQEITATLGYTDYAVKVVDKKIIISSYSAEGLKLAFDDILQKIRLVEIGDDTIWQISDDITTQNKISGWPAGLPIFAKGTASVYKTSDTIYEVNVKGTTAADYTSYLSELTKIGYTKYTENRIGVNTFATYTKDKTVVHIYIFQ